MTERTDEWKKNAYVAQLLARIRFDEFTPELTVLLEKAVQRFNGGNRNLPKEQFGKLRDFIGLPIEELTGIIKNIAESQIGFTRDSAEKHLGRNG